MEDASANAQVRKLKTLLRKAEDKVLNHDKVIQLNFFPAVLRCGKVFSILLLFKSLNWTSILAETLLKSVASEIFSRN